MMAKKTPKTIHELLASKLRAANRDLERIDLLYEDALKRRLDPDRLENMAAQLADHKAVIEAIGRMIKSTPDPRDTAAWRASPEGKALERERERDRMNRQ